MAQCAHDALYSAADRKQEVLPFASGFRSFDLSLALIACGKSRQLASRRVNRASSGHWGQPRCTDHVLQSFPRSRLDPNAGMAHSADVGGPPALAIVVILPPDRTRCGGPIPATLSRYVDQMTPSSNWFSTGLRSELIARDFMEWAPAAVS